MPRRRLQSELHKRRPFETPETEASLNLARTASALQLPFDRLFKAHDLSSSTYNVLRILRGHETNARDDGRRFEGVPCSTVAADMVVPVPDLTRLLDRLVAAGLAARRRSATDRRVVLLRLTAAGRRRLATLDPLVSDLHDAQLGHLSRPELARLNTLLEKARRPITS